MIRFYWLEPGILAGCSRPGARPGRHTAGDEEVATDLAELRGQGIGALLSLTESPLPAETLARHGHDLDILHLPVPDFHPPSPEQLGLALRFIDEHRGRRQAVAVHCLAGQGRTGSVLAAWMIRDGLAPAAAIARLRGICPGAVEAAAQVRALEEWGRARSWLV
ncbi:MAG: hypothetical protein AVDCRST_MAG59-4180 [uncultured Thermomicrobiales bacterium]|uniref:Tyrosine specific protein phosphatases domain-containing protein n=1 Tax=uncultured Thermomicrobiales bacterium TaxID=1645740 RepID=A0A6J4VDP2_9BACT|nr:MAG: hypothetical protein AVDCRST_MAG59-4180 [uncultured Thermomicrobiales bacterium]